MQSISLRIATTHGLIWREVRVPRVGSARLGPPPTVCGHMAPVIQVSRVGEGAPPPRLPSFSPGKASAHQEVYKQVQRTVTCPSSQTAKMCTRQKSCCTCRVAPASRTDLRATSRTLGPWVCPPGPRRRGRSPAPPTLCQPLPPAGAALLPVCFSAALLGFWGRGLPRATRPRLWSCVTLTSWETHSGGVWLVP